MYDATLGRELSRQLVDPVARPDVLKAYPSILNADKSGFDAYFDISRKGIPQGIHLSHNLLIISRYSDDLVNGEGNRVDYWFPAKQFFNMHAENRAYLDSVNIVNGRVHVTGWHATDLSQAAANRFLILHDDTRGQDVTYAKVINNISRPDVAAAFPSIKTAGDSGFDVTFNQVMLTPGDRYSLISRYSTSGDGDGGLGAKADYRMTIPSLFNINRTNAGNLDSITVTNGDAVTVTGWHATDYSLLANNHYLILFDVTANQQVAQARISNVARPDVARVYRYLQTAGNSGFSATFDHVQLQNGHTYALVSRYSISPNGNGDDGNASHHIDYWFNNALKVDNQNYHAYWIDSLKPDQQKDSIDVTGWMVSDASQTMPNAYLILLNGSQEIGRAKITLNSRSDVQKANPEIYNSIQSGINTSIKLDSGVDLTKLANAPLHLVLRFTSSSDGNSNYDDQWYNFTFSKSQVNR